MIRPYPSFPARAAVLLLLAPLFAQSAAGPPAKDYSFTVKAKMPWNDTKLNLKKGDLVHVYGGVLVCAAPVPPEKENLPLPSAPRGTLLAKLHLDADPILATPDAEIPALDNSHLYLGVNGVHCTGTLSVKVRVERGSGTSSQPSAR